MNKKSLSNTTSTLPKQNIVLRQTMLSFAYLAYTGERLTTSNPEPSILKSIKAALPKIKLSATNDTLKDWDVVWGPVTYTVPGALYQDNMVYVVKKANTSDYVIATRGTNFISQVDWFLEDFEVLNTMPWPMPNATSASKPGAVISESTSIGMNIQIDQKLMADNGVGLLSFLKSETASDSINVCVTGHSLGGVLSNTLALYLLENPKKWDTSGASTVSCISFAAPTAGNKLFAKNALAVFQKAASSKQSFPGWDASLKTNLDNVQCDLDIVPLFSTGTNVYKDDNAGAMFSIYASPNNPTNNINFDNLPKIAELEWKGIKSIVLKPLADAITPQNYTQLDSTPPIVGEFAGNTLNINVLDFGLEPFLKAYAAQAAWQHSNSYPIYLQVPILFNPTVIVRNDGASTQLPHIKSIDPSWCYGLLHPTGLKVKISGSNFSTNVYENFIVFSNPSNPLPYRIESATDTEIVAVFYTNDVKQYGEQSFFIYVSSPYYKSNSVKFNIKKPYEDEK